MPHRIQEKIEVQAAGGIPQTFVWRGRHYQVQRVLEWWKESGCWWDGGPGRLVFRVSDLVGQTFELHALLTTLFPQAGSDSGSKWMIHSVED